MKINQLDDQRVVIELESPQETAALWAVASRVGGNAEHIRSLFSGNFSHGTDRPAGLFEALTPIVAAQVTSKERRDFRGCSLTIRNLLDTLCHSRMSGRIELNSIKQRKDHCHDC